MTIIPYNRQNKKGEHKFISFRIKNSSPPLSPPLPLNKIRYVHTGTCSSYYLKVNHLYHKGTDIMTYPGTPVYSVCNGKVKYVHPDTRKSSYSQNAFVIIEHNCKGKKFYGYYGHIRASVRTGKVVKPGTVIGYIQDAPDNIGDHLHLGFANDYVSRGWGVASPTGTCSDALKRTGGFWSTSEVAKFFGWNWLKPRYH